jgi:class 3 adenylate cyclase
MLACARCGNDLPAGAPFCLSCGYPEGERKQVTVLIADLEGSMELLAVLDFLRGIA